MAQSISSSAILLPSSRTPKSSPTTPRRIWELSSITAQGKYEPVASSGFSFIDYIISAVDDIENVHTFLGRPGKIIPP
nr:pectinesterase-like [Ipomoea trifida]